jgi:hypothetical protein
MPNCRRRSHGSVLRTAGWWLWIGMPISADIETIVGEHYGFLSTMQCCGSPAKTTGWLSLQVSMDAGFLA